MDLLSRDIDQDRVSITPRVIVSRHTGYSEIAGPGSISLRRESIDPTGNRCRWLRGPDRGTTPWVDGRESVRNPVVPMASIVQNIGCLRAMMGLVMVAPVKVRIVEPVLRVKGQVEGMSFIRVTVDRIVVDLTVRTDLLAENGLRVEIVPPDDSIARYTGFSSLTLSSR